MPPEIPNNQFETSTNEFADAAYEAIDKAKAEINEVMETTKSIGQMKAALKNAVISAILKIRETKGDQGAQILAKYFEDEFRITEFSKNIEHNTIIKMETQNYLNTVLHPDIARKADGDPEDIEPSPFD